MSKFLSRKFLLTVLFSVIGFILVLTGHVGGEWYMGQLLLLSGIYHGSNVLEKASNFQTFSQDDSSPDFHTPASGPV